jgi:hypothetical protein
LEKLYAERVAIELRRCPEFIEGTRLSTSMREVKWRGDGGKGKEEEK